MHAYLITGNSKDKIEQKIQEIIKEKGSTEIITLKPEKKIHTISSIRELIRSLSFAPRDMTNGRIVLIYDAHLLNQEAGNAFLKNLENPQGNTTIILTSPNKDLILETIASRTQVVETKENSEKVNKEQENTLIKILGNKLGENLKSLDKIKDRDQAIEFCNNLIIVARELLISNPQSPKTKKLLMFLENAIQTKKDLMANVNIKMALGDLFIQNI